jgi:hypothetical protein
MTLERITILGSGTMGAGIAQTAMSSGFATTLYDISDELVQKAKSAISDRLEKLVEKGKIDAPSARRGESTIAAFFQPGGRRPGCGLRDRGDSREDRLEARGVCQDRGGGAFACGPRHQHFDADDFGHRA